MVTIIINGKEINVKKGTTILNAALENGIFIPHFCYHPALSISGNCRICLVEVEKMPKLLTACSTIAGDNMVVNTESDKVKKARAGIMEFLLLNHPLDCPECDKAGECMLQEYAFNYSMGKSRFHDSKEEYEIKDIGKSIYLWTRRCILCSRCIRFCREISGTSELGFIKRGVKVEVDSFPSKKLDNLMSTNTIDLCPVGALLDKEFFHKSRVWHLNSVKSICSCCSSGCNINVEIKNEAVYRIRPRYNPDVNKHWLCDIGKYGHKYIDNKKRILTPQIRVGSNWQKISYDEAVRTIGGRIKKIIAEKGNTVAGICSSFCSNEDAYALREIVKLLECNRLGVYSDFSSEEDINFKSGFTIKSDRSPNTIGTCQILEIGYESGASYTALLQDIDKGDVDLLIYLGGEPNHKATIEEIEILSKVELFISFAVNMDSFTSLANIVLPCETFVEKNGTYTSSDMRVQRFTADSNLLNTKGIMPVWMVLKEIAKCFELPFEFDSEEAIFDRISKEITKYNGMSYKSLSYNGEIQS